MQAGPGTLIPVNCLALGIHASLLWDTAPMDGLALDTHLEPGSCASHGSRP